MSYRELAMQRPEPPLLYAAELTGCSLLATYEFGRVGLLFADALTAAGATVVQQVTHHFPGAGQTCVLILAESHAVLHTWPETGTVNLDIFSCSSRLQCQAAIAELGEVFGATQVTVQEIPRADGHRHRSDP